MPDLVAVYTNEHLCFGNCTWDALGKRAMLRTDARIESSCDCCGPRP